MESPSAALPSGPLELSDEQQRRLHRTACRLVATAARRQPVHPDSVQLGELAAWPVVGVFVTLRHNGALRACIGNFAQSVRLDEALQRAATGAACHDPRFPPVRPEELPLLSVDVSLLHTRELLRGSPRERMAHVEIGRHGVDIQLRGHAGLLLPSVAVEHGWDAPQLLREVCRKAALPPDAWQDAEATLYRFSSTRCGGPWAE